MAPFRVLTGRAPALPSIVPPSLMDAALSDDPIPGAVEEYVEALSSHALELYELAAKRIYDYEKKARRYAKQPSSPDPIVVYDFTPG